MDSLFQFPQLFQRSLSQAVSSVSGVSFEPQQIHIFSRYAAASCALVGKDLDPSACAGRLNDARTEAFPPVFGVCPVERVWEKNGWLLFDPSKTLLSAAATKCIAGLPKARDDCGVHAMNRLMGLSRRGGNDVCQISSVQKAFFSLLCLGEHPQRQAMEAVAHQVEIMLLDVMPSERHDAFFGCGSMADAMARLLYFHLTQE